MPMNFFSCPYENELIIKKTIHAYCSMKYLLLVYKCMYVYKCGAASVQNGSYLIQALLLGYSIKTLSPCRRRFIGDRLGQSAVMVVEWSGAAAVVACNQMIPAAG